MTSAAARNLFTLLALLVSAGRTPGAAPPVRTLVIIGRGFAIDDLAAGRMPVLRGLADRGGVGLMNCAVGGLRSDLSMLVSLACGDHIAAEPGDDEIVAASSPTSEGDPAGVVYSRRTGAPVPAPGEIVHVNWASLVRRRIASRTLGAVVAAAGCAGRVRVICASMRPADRAIYLLALDKTGVGPRAISDLDDALADGVTVLVAEEGIGPVEAAIAAAPTDARVLVLSLRPPVDEAGRWRRRLGLAVLAGPGVGPGLLTSATTRTAGICAIIDPASSVLEWLGAKEPASMVGHSLRVDARPDGVPAALALDRGITSADRAQGPIFMVLGPLAGIGVFGLILGAALGAPRTVRAAAGVLLALAAMPLGLLLAAGLWRAPWVAPASGAALAVPALGLMAALAYLCYLLGRRRRLPPIVVLFCATVACLVLDGVAQQPLGRFSVLSGFMVSGIRFYGVGNEHMGVLIGMLVTALLTMRVCARISAPICLAVLLVIGLPALGANAGGLIAATAGFGACCMVASGRHATWPAAALWAVGGLALAFGLALMERLAAPAHISHIGDAIGGANEAGWGSLLGIAIRKATLNLRFALHPGAMAAIVGFGLVGWLARRPAAGLVDAVGTRWPGWRAAARPIMQAAAAAFLFNDSGVVAALFIVGAWVVAGLTLAARNPGWDREAPADAL